MNNIISHEEISSFCLELSLLLHAGVTTGDALSYLAQESEGERARMLSLMAKDVDDGADLAQAVRKANCFPIYVTGLLEVGERSGRTEEALKALSAYYENRARLDRRVRSSLLYPAVMLGLMLIVIGVLLIKVLPIFNDVYASLGGALTGVAGGLLSLGRWLDGAMPALWAILLLLVLFLLAFAALPAFRHRALAWWRSTFGDRGVSKKMNSARLAQALAMGMQSGLPLEEALDLAAGLMEDIPPARKRCLDCRALLEQGLSQSEALKQSGLLGAGPCRLLELATRSGSADAAMGKIAADLAEESEAALEEKVSRVEPALVLTCSVLVGLILLSVMLPLMHIMSAIG